MMASLWVSEAVAFSEVQKVHNLTPIYSLEDRVKPVIGITSGLVSEHELNGFASSHEMHQLGDTYVQAIEHAGGIPIVLPSYESVESAKASTSIVDALLFSGGSDFDPNLFGMRPIMQCRRIVPRRDVSEFALGRFALEETSLPILGICRGCQLLNVLKGGDLYLDLSEDGKLAHQLTMYPRELPSHYVRIDRGSRLYDAFREEEIGVNSFHHQAVRTVGAGFVATAHSLPDNVVEGIELEGSRFVVGVQWHPEGLIINRAQLMLFRRLVEAAISYKLSRLNG